MPEFQELHELAHGYGEFAAQVETYNRLGSDQHKRFDTVPPLVKYVFGVDLEQRFIKNSEFYADALANASYRPFELRTVSPKVIRRARGSVGLCISVCLWTTQLASKLKRYSAL